MIYINLETRKRYLIRYSDINISINTSSLNETLKISLQIIERIIKNSIFIIRYVF